MEENGLRAFQNWVLRKISGHKRDKAKGMEKTE
jgi:hypothetical protein